MNITDKNKRAATVECFQLKVEIINATPSEAIDPDNYIPVSAKSCASPKLALCSICFDIEEFPLENALPDFANQPILSTLVTTHMGSKIPGIYTDSGSGYSVELDFRP